MAAAAPVPNDVVRQHRVITRGDERGDLSLDLFRVGLLRPAEAPREAAEVGVDRQPRHVERVAEHDVGRLAPDPGQGDEVAQAPWNFAVIALAERLPEPDEGVCLRPKEAGRPDEVLEFVTVGGGIGGRVAVAGEQWRCHEVDPPVGALRREDRGDEQLERGREVEFAVGVGVGLGQDPVHAPGTPDKRRTGFTRRRAQLCLRHPRQPMLPRLHCGAREGEGRAPARPYGLPP